MVREAATSFKEFRNFLYSEILKKACVPRFISDGVITEQNENRFFPAGTAKTVFTFDTLEQLFALVIGTGQLPSQGLPPSRLAQQVEIRKLHVFLAILIVSKCDIEALLAFTQKLVAPENWTESEHKLAQLPHEHSRGLRAILGADDATADLFMEKQHDFLAPVIRKNQEVTGRYRRRPYVSERSIGEGSFGKIYEVIIAPHHFRNEHSIGNDREMPLARKDFELNSAERAHEKERDVISEIVRNAKQHKNIMKSLGSLQIGSTYSLFMPLADCDLKQYMERYPSPPSSSKQKAEIMDCAVGLAGAIVYLQDELETPYYEKLSCFHMDLKPQNILVVKDPKTGKYQWKLSDFNMSRVKMKRIETIDQNTLRRSMTSSDGVYDINKLFRRRAPLAADASAYTINRRGAGTYLAPEACIENYPVGAESDTWSLGSVISVVLSYLFGGQNAVQEFSDMRGKNGNDRFFYAKGGGDKLHKLSDARVNNAVKKWHQHLRDVTKKENPKESAIFAKLVEFLDNKVLVIDPKQRKETSALDIRNKLIVAFKEFGNIVDPPFVSRPAPTAQTSWIDKVFRRAVPEAELRHWDIPMPTTVRICAFGPSAQPLVIVTDGILTACSPKHLLLSNDASLSQYDLINYGKASPEEKSRRWIPNVGVSAQYILAATDYHEFDCYFYHISNPDTHLSELKLVAHWELSLPKIYKLAMSPDAQYAAFILFEPSRGQNSSLYITRLDWLQGVNSVRKHLSIVSASSGSSASVNSHLGRAIPLHWPAEDVCELKFSESNILYVVVKPRQSNVATENVMHVLAWSLEQEQRIALPRSPIKHDGKDDLLQSLFTSFAPFNQGAAFAIISEERTIITRACESKRFSQRHARGHRLYQLLMTQDDRGILAFGTSEGRNDSFLFNFPVTTTTEQLDCRNKTKIPGLTNRSKFVPAITTTTYNSHNQRHLLIAVMEDRMVRTIRLDLET